jgi:HAE1 family hydrophobic/amphiphilic exporter-1
MRLLRVPGVGTIKPFTDDFSMRIWMNPEKMAAYSLTPQDVINALNAQNVQVAAGTAGVPPQAPTQTYELGILVNGRLSKVSEFENIIVKNNPSVQTGELVYLKDVARVELGKFTFPVIHLLTGTGHLTCRSTRRRAAMRSKPPTACIQNWPS